jgi:hypothetical protein
LNPSRGVALLARAALLGGCSSPSREVADPAQALTASLKGIETGRYSWDVGSIPGLISPVPSICPTTEHNGSTHGTDSPAGRSARFA